MCCAENVEAELQQGARRGDISYDGNHGIGRAFGGGSSLPAGTWTHAGSRFEQPTIHQPILEGHSGKGSLDIGLVRLRLA